MFRGIQYDKSYLETRKQTHILLYIWVEDSKEVNFSNLLPIIILLLLQIIIVIEPNIY